MDQLLERMVLHRQVGVHPLELGVLCLQLSDAPQFGDLKSAVLALPTVVGRLADGVFAAHFGHFEACLYLLQDRHDLTLAEPTFFHRVLGCPPPSASSFELSHARGSLQCPTHLARGAWRYGYKSTT